MATCRVGLPDGSKVAIPENLAHLVQAFIRREGKPFTSAKEVTKFLSTLNGSSIVRSSLKQVSV